MTEGLTGKQQAIIDFIRVYAERHGYPPSIREIGRQFAIRSTNAVNDHLKALERKGKLRRDEFKSRGLALAEPLLPVSLSGRLVEVPVLGMVPAGSPMAAVQEVEDSVYLDSFFVAPDQEVFALRVRGESMIGDGIYDGDFLFVRKGLEAQEGAIVVAMVEGEATVKRWYKQADGVRLQPSNPAMQPTLIPWERYSENLILGSVVGVFRRM